MSRRVPLREVAHARAGDKGNTSNVSVWLRDPAHFDAVRRQLTPARLKREFPNLLKGSIRVFTVPHLAGLNIVMEEALEGGVNGSLGLDGHGKSWSFLMLGLEVEI
ncbi:MAG: hypothetical protein U1E14_09470 [Geminicoccaceae bacterium]